jgi:dihydrofolate synthase/folylpolyglutamate synthase
LAVGDLHPLVVVGSKGKGTTATYAAATLRSAGLRVGLITSPGYRSHRERVRLDGVALTPAEFAAMASSLSAALSSLPPRSPGSGYVSPTGAFTLAGLTWLVGRDVDALVVEAGMGGASDESSLTLPSVVAVTPIFEEHLGVIGDDLAAVARDKAGTINPFTRSVVSAPQSPAVVPVIEAALTPLPEAAPEGGARFAPVSGAASSLVAVNAAVGCSAAQEYLRVLGRDPAPAELPEVRLPGRQSLHGLDDQTWAVDSAISPVGIQEALAWCRAEVGDPTTILLSIPDTKDHEACLQALAGQPVIQVRSRAPHLTYPPDLPTLTQLPPLGDRVLALGTISFIGEVLDLLDVDMERLF